MFALPPALTELLSTNQVVWEWRHPSLGHLTSQVREPFHLFRYLDEESFRFNTKEQKDAVRFRVVTGSIVGKRLTYAELTGKTATTPA